MVDQVKLVTVDEFEEYVARSENADRRFELIDGEIVEKVPTEEHSLIAGNLYAALRAFVKPNGLGRVAFEVRHKQPGDFHNARLPDVEFTRKERVQPVVSTGSVAHMPDLAVEVKSPTDSYIDLRKKALYYLENGTQLVWLVYPAKQQIEIWTGDTSKTIGLEDTLDGGDLLPGFLLPVREIFDIE